MSGIGMAAGSSKTASAGPAPLSCTLEWQGPNPLDVSGASGHTFTYMATSITGGSGTYVAADFVPVANSSTKISLFGVSALSWSGFLPNESQYVTLRFRGEDDAGAVAFSDPVTITLRRTS